MLGEVIAQQICLVAQVCSYHTHLFVESFIAVFIAAGASRISSQGRGAYA